MSLELNWNYNEFCTYLLIYAAYSDLEFTEDERSLILNNIDKESFDKIEQEFLSNSDYRSLQIIMDHKGIYYPTEDQKKELLARVKTLFKVDGEYSRIEKTLLMFLEKLL